MAKRKLLCIADGTPECKKAVIFGAIRAKNTDSKLIILRIIEPIDNSLWGMVGEAARQELLIEAENDMESFKQLVFDEAGFYPDIIIKNGQAHEEIRNVIDEDNEIKSLLLAAGGSKYGPGPLVAAATRGSFGFGMRRVTIMIIPDLDNIDEIKELAN